MEGDEPIDSLHCSPCTNDEIRRAEGEILHILKKDKVHQRIINIFDLVERMTRGKTCKFKNNIRCLYA